jgi:hypothetical protein
MVDGHAVRTCLGFGLQQRQRSVSLVGFPENEIKRMLYEKLGYDRTADRDEAEKVEKVAHELSNSTSAAKNYRFNIYHFTPAQLRLTTAQVRFAHTQCNICPDVPPEVVRTRTQLVIGGAAPADALAFLPEQPGRLDPRERTLRTAKHDLDTLAPASSTNSIARPRRAVRSRQRASSRPRPVSGPSLARRR